MKTIIRVAASMALLPQSTVFAFAADQTLIDAARREGVVNWYTTQIVDQFARPAAAAFERTYGIKVDFTRSDPGPIVLRIVNESHTGQMQADVFDSAPVAAALKREGLSMQWRPSGAERLGPRLFDKDAYWTATNLYVLTPAFNTDVVPRGTEPRSWNDLLDPRWKGRMAWNSQITTAGGAGFVGLVLTELGEESGRQYLQKLARQNIAPVSATARQVVDQMIAGEYAIALQIFNNHPVISAGKGAPSDWIPMSPAFEYMSVVGITRSAPHPNAARLFVDFLISPEGQAIYRDADYMPADPSVPTRAANLRPDGDRFRSVSFTPEVIDEKSQHWMTVFKELFP